MRVSVPRAVAALGLPLASLALSAPFTGPDVMWGPRKFIGAWLGSALAAASLWGWGALLARGRDPAFAPAFGTLAAAALLFTLGLLGALAAAPLYFALLVGGLYFFRFPRGSIWVLPFFMLALVPNPHPDPLYYHLLSARRWYEAGRIYFDTSQPLFLLGGLWDLLYIWPIACWKVLPAQELVYQQLAAQSITLLLGAAGTFGLVASSFRRLGLRDEPAAWSALATVASPVLLPVAFAAKNDWGLLLWLAAGARLAFENGRGNRALAGLFFGAAIANKWGAAPASAALALAMLARDRKYAGAFFGGLAAGLLPIVARNLLFTGVPFFPLFTIQHLSFTNRLIFEAYRAVPRPASFLPNLARLAPAVPAMLLTPFAFFRTGSRAGAAFVAGGLAVLGALLALVLHPMLSWRLSAPYPLLVAAFGVWGLAKFSGERVWSLRLAGIALLALALWPARGLVGGLLRQPAEVIRGFDAGDAMAFVRLREGPREPVVVGGNPGLYYLSGFAAVTPEAIEDFDALLASSKASAYALALRDRGFRWYVETRAPDPRGRGSFLISHLLEDHAAAVVFTGTRGRVTDLKAMAAWIRSPDFQERPLPPEGVFIPPQD